MPRLAASCLPTLAVPVIDGFVVATAFISTRVVVADHQVRGEVPSLSARTATEMNLFAYSGITLRVFPMAPEIAVQSLGSALRGSYEYELHAYHCLVRVGVGYPVHVPSTALSVFVPAEVANGVPKMLGFTFAWGRRITSVLVAVIHVVELVPALWPVTAAAMYLPTCSDSGSKTKPLASSIAEQNTGIMC